MIIPVYFVIATVSVIVIGRAGTMLKDYIHAQPQVETEQA